MKKNLVPFDFSKPAISALRFASDFAERSKGKVKLVYVIELPVLHNTLLMPTLNFEKELLKELHDKAANRFEKIMRKYGRESVQVSWEVLFGTPSKTLLDLIKAEEFDLVIMGSHGASGLREHVIGSNAEKMIRRSPVPVLATKKYRKRAVKNIVFPNTLETKKSNGACRKNQGFTGFLSGAFTRGLDKYANQFYLRRPDATKTGSVCQTLWTEAIYPKCF